MRMTTHAGLRSLIVLAALIATPIQAAVVSCPASGGGGDGLDRGFYVQNYPAGSLGTVTLLYNNSGTAGPYTVSLTANAGAYNGPLIGTVIASATVAAPDTPMTFDFGNAPVTPGTIITFTQVLVSGPGGLFYDIGNGALGVMDNTCPNVIETSGTSPPLDVFRRNSVALAINASVAAGIPTLGTLGLILLAFTLAGIAALRWRRS